MAEEHDFFVAMAGPDSGYAACSADDPKIVKGFFRKHAGVEIRKVKGGVMRLLLDSYVNRHHRKQCDACGTVTLDDQCDCTMHGNPENQRLRAYG